MENVAINIADSRWEALDIDGLAKAAIAQTLNKMNIDATLAEISVLACDDARIAALNAEFRGKPQPTNVLSWPAQEWALAQPGDVPPLPAPDFEGVIALGDIAISYETCTREAAEANRSVQHHASHLLVHGMLHLLGYDHINDADAALMEGLEIEILGKLGVDNPY
ncbi:MAG: rRNA maturation RNase YbeY [Pseudomonadota bacterium]